MNLNQLKNVIKQTLTELRQQSGGGRKLLKEAKTCSCCGRLSAGLAAQECMDGGGVATGHKTECGYNVSCSGMSTGPRTPGTAQGPVFGNAG